MKFFGKNDLDFGDIFMQSVLVILGFLMTASILFILVALANIWIGLPFIIVLSLSGLVGLIKFTRFGTWLDETL